MFKLGGEQESLAVIFTDEYFEIIDRISSDLPLTKKFKTKILEPIPEISIEKPALTQAGFTEAEIKYYYHPMTGCSIFLNSLLFFCF